MIIPASAPRTNAARHPYTASSTAARGAATRLPTAAMLEFNASTLPRDRGKYADSKLDPIGCWALAPTEYTVRVATRAGNEPTRLDNRVPTDITTLPKAST